VGSRTHSVPRVGSFQPLDTGAGLGVVLDVFEVDPLVSSLILFETDEDDEDDWDRFSELLIHRKNINNDCRWN